jgi:peptidoglycan/xylan/chitin deacetylase (PgdA/CDA1 family)
LLGLNVSQAFSGSIGPAVVITFDDGCETDLLTASPILAEANFNATFFITLGFLDQHGYLSRTQLRALGDQGFDIGCHSKTHSYLTDLDEAGLLVEIAQAKDELEQIIGKKVENFSCPGGRWDNRVARIACESGYQTVSTSRVIANSINSDRYRLGRVAIMRGTGPGDFERICRSEGLWQMRLRDDSHTAVRRLLGNKAYDRIRALALGSSTSSKASSE